MVAVDSIQLPNSISHEFLRRRCWNETDPGRLGIYSLLIILIITYRVSFWASVSTGTLLTLLSILSLQGILKMLTHILSAVTHSFKNNINSSLLSRHDFHPVPVGPVTHTHIRILDEHWGIAKLMFLASSGASSLTSSPRSPLSPLFPRGPGSPCHNTDICTCIRFSALCDTLLSFCHLCTDLPEVPFRRSFQVFLVRRLIHHLPETSAQYLLTDHHKTIWNLQVYKCFFHILLFLLSVHKDQGLPLVQALPAGPGSRKHRFQYMITSSWSHNTPSLRLSCTYAHVCVRVFVYSVTIGLHLNKLTAENVNAAVIKSRGPRSVCLGGIQTLGVILVRAAPRVAFLNM